MPIFIRGLAVITREFPLVIPSQLEDNTAHLLLRPLNLFKVPQYTLASPCCHETVFTFILNPEPFSLSSVIYICSQLPTDFNLLIMNLMVTELIVSAYGISIAAVASAQKGWKMGETFCKASGFILTVLGEVLIFCFSLVSLLALVVHDRSELYGYPDYSVNIPLNDSQQQGHNHVC
jgi:hypothetical protein